MQIVTVTAQWTTGKTLVHLAVVSNQTGNTGDIIIFVQSAPIAMEGTQRLQAMAHAGCIGHFAHQAASVGGCDGIACSIAVAYLCCRGLLHVTS